MIKIVRKLHMGAMIYFTKEEMELFRIHIGDKIDMTGYFKEMVEVNINKKGDVYKRMK